MEQVSTTVPLSTRAAAKLRGVRAPGVELCSPHRLLEAQAAAPTQSQLCSPVISSSVTFTLRFFLTGTCISALFSLSVSELHGVIPREVNSSPSAHLHLVKKRYWLSRA